MWAVLLSAMATAAEVAQSTVGLSGTMARGPAGLRFRAEHMAYVPRVAGRPHAASVVWLGVDLVVRFDR